MQTDSNWHWQSVAAVAVAFGLGLSHVAHCEPNQQARAGIDNSAFISMAVVSKARMRIGCLGQDE